MATTKRNDNPTVKKVKDAIDFFEQRTLNI